MAHIRESILVLLVSFVCIALVNGQATIPVTGRNATGTGGLVSYTIGQITYQTLTCTTGSVAHLVGK